MVVEAATTRASDSNQQLSHPVCFVGAGPGASDLLTLRAADRLRQADVLLWTDSLVCPQITALAPDACERIRTSTLTLEEVMRRLPDYEIDLANSERNRTEFVQGWLRLPATFEAAS